MSTDNADDLLQKYKLVPKNNLKGCDFHPSHNLKNSNAELETWNQTSSEYMKSYENILEPGKQPRMTKEYKPKIPQHLEKYLTPEELKNYVFDSQKIQKLIEFYSKKTGQSKKNIEKQIRDILNEIGLARNLCIIRWCGMVITAVATRICSAINVNRDSLTRIKNEFGKNPVLYLPSHRSYCDFILMSYICFHYDVEIPGIAAGMDFHAMAGMGTMLRKTGAFFMRRSFSGDEMYWDIFREYMNALTSVYHIGVEFFIEGTRSRNFKALVPKVGLLSMALQSFFMGKISDITIVPISISYERLLEEQLFVCELMGIPKPKESTKGFFKALKIVEERYGSMYVDFGEPISVQKYFGNRFDRTKYANLADHIQKLDRNEIEILKDLANEIVYQQQRKIVITTFNLICLYYSYSVYKKIDVNLNNLSHSIIKLKNFFESMGALIATNSTSAELDIVKTCGIHSNILHLFQGHLRLNYNSQKKLDFNKIDLTKLKGHSLSHEVMKLSVPILSVQLYTNACMFWLARPAITVLGAMQLKNEFSESELREKTEELNRIFGNEFILTSKKSDQAFIEILLLLSEYGILTRLPNRKFKFSRNEISEILCSSMAPFLCMYLRLAETILDKFDSKDFTEKDLLIANQKYIEELLMLRKKYTHPYCLALDNLSIAINSFLQNNYLIKFKDVDNNFKYKSNSCVLEKLKNLMLNYCNLLPFERYFDENIFTILAKL